MADSANYNRLLNPWVLQFQKLGLELKCPLCLSLLNRPILLPCDHVFCNFCVPRATQFGSECPICKQQYADRDIRPARYMENMITIYRSLDATFAANLFDPVYSVEDAGRVPDQRLVSVDRDADGKVRSASVETTKDGNSSNGQPIFLVTANKRVQVSPNLSVEDGAKLTGKSDKSTLQKASQHEGCENSEAGMGFCGVHVCIGAEEVDITQVVQSSQGSPPSSVDRKAVNDVIRVPGSNIDSVKKYSSKRTLKECSDQVRAEMNDRASLEVDDHAGEVKRQRILGNGLSDFDAKINGQAQSMHITTSKLESKSVEFPGAEATTKSDSSDTYRSVCAFCQSSKLTDVTGPMFHYANGKEVVGDASTSSNVIHVHRVCVDWTPQVYYVGDKVKNLKAEISRAAKLSCSSCRLKGAALGCYVKSCRKSYHVPCAVETSGCKWDQDDFLLLCPSHSSVKFPREKFKAGKHSSENKHQLSTQIGSKLLSFWAASPNGVKEWVFCGSAQSADEKYLLVKFASICGATVSKFWKPNVTHVIAATDATGAYCRTLKVLMAILNGRWVLSIDWIKACMEAMHPVDEELYEVNLDNYGCSNGPKTGRLRALDNAPKLFNGLNFYFCGDFLPGYKEDLLDLVIIAGGTVSESKDQLESPIRSMSVVVYNDPPHPFGEGSLAFQRLEAENLADEIGSRVIPHTWLLESIAACKLNPLAS